MAAPRTNLKIDAILTALSINGEKGTAAKKFVELVQKVEALDENQYLIRARDLTKEHVGSHIEFGHQFVGILTDIEIQQRPGIRYGMTLNLGMEDPVADVEIDEDEEGVRVSARGPVTIVLNGRLLKLHRNALLTVTK